MNGEVLAQEATTVAATIRRHLRWGWWLILIFLVLGSVLETFHGLKIGFYLDVHHSTRRLLWTLAHAHGTLLGLMHLAFAFTLRQRPPWPARPCRITSRCLTSAGLLLPAGFFLGGLFCFDGDPGLPILLVPMGGLLLVIAVGITVRVVSREPDS